MLETYYKDKRTLENYRRGPLGLHLDGFATYLTKKGYAQDSARRMLKQCSLFNTFLMDHGIFNIRFVKSSYVERFLDFYSPGFRNASGYKRTSGINKKCALKHLFTYLAEIGELQPELPGRVTTRYSWLMEPYLKYLGEECQLTKTSIQTTRKKLVDFLEELGDQVRPRSMKSLRAETIEEYFKKHLGDSRHNLRLLAGALRGFLRFCVREGYMAADLSGVIPSIPLYRLSSLPKGMNDPTLKRILHSVHQATSNGSRDYAILLVMMAYGMRGKQAAELLLEDIDWERSTIRIRPVKGGKEVILPLLESVGEAILRYLRYRPKTSCRTIFLWSRAPFRSLTDLAISQIVRKHMVKARVKVPKSGSNTFRHSWAIRALAHNKSIKAIADVLGHRCLDTTYIYAKADLKTLRQVAMPWVEVAS